MLNMIKRMKPNFMCNITHLFTTTSVASLCSTMYTMTSR